MTSRVAAAKNDRTEMERLPRVENCNSAGLKTVANAGVLFSSIVFVRRLVLSSSVVTRTLYPSLFQSSSTVLLTF